MSLGAALASRAIADAARYVMPTQWGGPQQQARPPGPRNARVPAEPQRRMTIRKP